MRHHHQWQLPPHLTIGYEVFVPELTPRLVNRRQSFMAVEVGSAEAGEMLATPEDSCLVQSGEKRARIAYGLCRIRRDRARTQDVLRFPEPQINTWREVDVKSQRSKLLTDQLPMFPEQLE